MYEMLSGLLSVVIAITSVGSIASANNKSNHIEANTKQEEKIIENEYESFGKTFVRLLADRNYIKAVEIFDSNMKKMIPEDKLKEAWEGLTSQVGGLEKQLSTKLEIQKQLTKVVVTCEFEKAMVDISVVFTSDKQITGLRFTPTNIPPKQEQAKVNNDLYYEEEVTIGKGEWKLPGTLSIPKKGSSVPVVVLVHGSGPQDRDSTIGPNKPFADLAKGLASKGIAVLRYEKRTMEHASKFTSIANNITVKEETIDDALAAVAMLRNRKEINKNRIFVVGHSLGGMLVPRIGKEDKNIKGFVVMAGPTRPFEDLILEQMTYLSSLDGKVTQEEKEYLENVKVQVAMVKKNLSKDTPSSKLPLGVPANYWIDLKGYNPAVVAKTLDKPMLVLQGERDYQVTMKDFTLWKKALSSTKKATFKSYKDLNHLFLKGEGKPNPEEYMTAGHIDSAVINDIVNWINVQK
ncbi:alpha/beta fold hydrolase [Clostridium tagluense]|uniref:alpha/beta fold hydrolase n=1 Tax=Clostridium tagluense TaxID=360422 RepID=UPI001C0ADEBA|nr:alpha/beta fold hydrolase [Clostridium tagluense]MBU3126116.1 alpha/beta fold hydrolase [Clostridium tagluense]